jgi:general stress protein 26
MTTTATKDELEQIGKIITGSKIAVLTTMTEDGRLVSRPLATVEVEFDGDVWFFVERDSTTVRHISDSPQVNVGVGSGGTWVSLSGDAVVVDDAAKKKELWNSGVEAWFPQGPDDDSVVLIRCRRIPRSTGTAPAGWPRRSASRRRRPAGSGSRPGRTRRWTSDLARQRATVSARPHWSAGSGRAKK